MKHILLPGLALSALVSLTSCAGFLDEDARGRLTPSEFFSSKEDLDMSLNALYERVEQTQTYTNMQIPQWAGDDLTSHPASNKGDYRECDRFNVSNTNKGVTAAWNAHYSLIMAANGIINNAEKTPADKKDVDSAIGNALYWRAYSYFYLVRLFGPLPLNLTNESDNYTTPLTSVEKVYEQIVSDLQKAVTLLPDHYSDAPAHLFNVDVFVTSQAARATLSAVYMAMAGFPMNRTEYYKSAAEEAKKVLDGKFYTLDSDWKNVYSIANNYNAETVLGISNSAVLGSWDHDSELSSCLILSSSGFGGWNDAMSEIKFWVDYPAGPRKDCVFEPQILRESDMKLYNWYDKDEDGTPIFSEYHPAFSIYTYNVDNGKLVNAPFDYRLPKYSGMTTGHRHRVIRLSEVMLWYAESAARSGQDLAVAKEMLKTVHNRACTEKDAIGGVSIDAMDADQLAKAAYDEHGWEVACNWVALVPRRADQLRTNTLRDNFERRKVNAPIAIPGTDYTATETTLIIEGDTWDDDRNYLPYPSNDSSKNSSLKRKSLLD